MKKWIVFLLILVVLIAILFFVINIKNTKNNGNSEASTKENPDNEITGNIVKDGDESLVISENVVSGEGSEGSSSPRETSEVDKNPATTPTKELPLDLYTKPCSYYFLEYGVCAGVCPSGECLVDDKSCYCRSV